MNLAWRLKDKHAWLCGPFMLNVSPLALDNITIDRRRVTVAIHYPALGNSQQIYPLSIGGIQN
jgi:hypothetical protein